MRGDAMEVRGDAMDDADGPVGNVEGARDMDASADE